MTNTMVMMIVKADEDRDNGGNVDSKGRRG